MTTDIIDQTDPAQWDPKLDAVIAAPANHKVRVRERPAARA